MFCVIPASVRDLRFPPLLRITTYNCFVGLRLLAMTEVSRVSGRENIKRQYE
ncbi:hypothetical protein [Candidatus Tisiphia endosymbiont of Hybos culiciformis]|uniref:hypothetical protein n=1 Tax=Candidatus Tisiphia endosymbiont of Hybos culiciformis TaxID=3139331 RepID=UPI003CCB4BCD